MAGSWELALGGDLTSEALGFGRGFWISFLPGHGFEVLVFLSSRKPGLQGGEVKLAGETAGMTMLGFLYTGGGQQLCVLGFRRFFFRVGGFLDWS